MFIPCNSSVRTLLFNSVGNTGVFHYLLPVWWLFISMASFFDDLMVEPKCLPIQTVMTFCVNMFRQWLHFSIFSPLLHLSPCSSTSSPNFLSCQFFFTLFSFSANLPIQDHSPFHISQFSTLCHPSSNNSNQTIQLTLVNFNINPNIKFSFNYVKQIMEQNRRYSDLVYITNVLSSQFASAIPTQRFQ